jgi:hypothetical protein
MSPVFPFAEYAQQQMHVGAFGIVSARCIKSTSSQVQLVHTAACSLTLHVLLWRADPPMAAK